MFDEFEDEVRHTLRKLAKQRVRMVVRPGNFWVIDNALVQGPNTHAALLTCYMRGWVEPLPDAVPSAALPASGEIPSDLRFDKIETIYRLTSAGWSAIHRSGAIAIVALLISALSFAMAMAGRLFH